MSRDPKGEATDSVGNLCPYVGGNPTNYVDRLGLAGGAMDLLLPVFLEVCMNLSQVKGRELLWGRNRHKAA